VFKCDKGSDAIYCSAKCKSEAKPTHDLICSASGVSNNSKEDSFSALRDYSRAIGNPIGLIIGKVLTRVLSTIKDSDRSQEEVS